MWSQEALCGARRPSSVEPGGPMWSQEALLCRARKPSSVEPGGPLWIQEALYESKRPYVDPGGAMRVRRPYVEPGGPPL